MALSSRPGAGGRRGAGAAVWGRDRKKNTDSRAVRRQDGPSIRRGGRRQQQQHHFIVLMALSVGGRRKKTTKSHLALRARWLASKPNEHQQTVQFLRCIIIHLKAPLKT